MGIGILPLGCLVKNLTRERDWEVSGRSDVIDFCLMFWNGEQYQMVVGWWDLMLLIFV